MSAIRDQLGLLHAQMRAAEARAGRPPGSAGLLAVSKGATAADVAEAIDAGQCNFGENRVQELEEKRDAVAGLRPDVSIRWELIGPLQSNKARRALVAADRIDSVDRLELLQKIVAISQRAATSTAIALQVNIGEDPAKAGFTPGAFRAALPEIAALLRNTAVRVDGLLTIGRLTDDPSEARATFAAFATFASEIRIEASQRGLSIGTLLSMGMSGDFEAAIEEGATQVRLGSALFRARG